MNQVEITNFINDLKTLYDNKLNTTTITYDPPESPETGLYKNVEVLRTQIHSEIDKIQIEYEKYKTELNASIFIKTKQTLTSILSYILVKYPITSDDVNFPDVENVFDSDGIKSLFSYYKKTLPVITSPELNFTIEHDVGTNDGTLNIPTSYTTVFLKSISVDLIKFDLDNLDALTLKISSSYVDRTLYQMLKTVITKYDNKFDKGEYLKTNLQFNQVLSDFSWVIKGLN